jgi:hypothetical protein
MIAERMRLAMPTGESRRSRCTKVAMEIAVAEDATRYKMLKKRGTSESPVPDADNTREDR